MLVLVEAPIPHPSRVPPWSLLSLPSEWCPSNGNFNQLFYLSRLLFIQLFRFERTGLSCEGRCIGRPVLRGKAHWASHGMSPKSLGVHCAQGVGSAEDSSLESRAGYPRPVHGGIYNQKQHFTKRSTHFPGFGRIV